MVTPPRNVRAGSAARSSPGIRLRRLSVSITFSMIGRLVMISYCVR